MAAALLDMPDLALALLPLIAETGSLSQSAQALGVSQPAASKALARAEAVTGLLLVRRDCRPLALTAEGELVAAHARRRAELDRTLAARLAASRSQGAGLVRIASFGASASTHILPRMLAGLRRLRPELQVEISEGADVAALQALQDGLADFAIAVESADERFEMLPLARDRLVALVRDDDPLARRPAVDAATLAARPFIMSKGGSEPLIRAWFAAAGCQPAVRHAVLQITSILAMVRESMGVAIIAEMAVPATHAGVTVLDLEPAYPRTVCLARRTGSFPGHAAELFWAYAAGQASA